MFHILGSHISSLNRLSTGLYRRHRLVVHFLLDDLRIASRTRLPAHVLVLHLVELDIAAAPVLWRARVAIALIPWKILVVLGPLVLLLPRGAVALLLFLWR